MTQKNRRILALALLFLLCSHLHLSYDVVVDGHSPPSTYTAKQLRRARVVAAEVARELLPSLPPEPTLHCRPRLSLRAPTGDLPLLTDTLLRAYPGIVLADGVFVNGQRLGTVEDGSELYARLRESILGQMPNAAVFGNISGELQISPVYSRAGHETNYDDMVLLICGMAPVIYLDGEGKLA